MKQAIFGSVCALAGALAGAAPVAAQPQPQLNPAVSRYPVVSLPDTMDTVADMELAQEYGTVVGGLAPIKLFVLGTTRRGTDSAITLARYGVDGTYEDSVSWPSAPTSDPVITFREAKAMTIPVVAAQSPGSDPDPDRRIFVAGTTDGAAASRDIVILAFNYDLKLLWMKTYNHEPYEGYSGDDIPVAIITDQNPDPILHSPGYNFVAVLGSSQGTFTGRDFVTLALAKDDGCEVMPAKRDTLPWYGNDVPVDIAVGPACGPGAPNPPASCIYITGGRASGSTPGVYQWYTTGYLIYDADCPTLYSNGAVATGWPQTAGGSFSVPNQVSVSSLPCRMKVMKNALYIAGTTWPYGDLGPLPYRDFLTVAYDMTSPCHLGYSANQWDFKQNLNGASRIDSAADMDVLFSSAGVLLAVTGTSSGTSAGVDSQIATVLYSAGPGLAPLWVYGAMWSRNETARMDRGIGVQLIGTTTDVLNSAANVYITGRSQSESNGEDFVTLKYDSSVFGVDRKPLSWLANLPFYNHTSNLDDAPVRVVVPHQPDATALAPRRIFVSGTSRDATSGDDWATQTIVEQP